MALFDWIYGEGIIIPFLRSAVEQNIPLAQVLEDFGNEGISARPELVTQVYNYLTGAVRLGAEYVKYLQQFATPNIARLPFTLTKTAYNFTYTLELQYLTPFGEIQTATRTITTNTLMTKQQAIDLASDRFALGSERSPPIDNAAYTVTNIQQNPGGLISV
jgi:hypothetical protein